MDAHVSLNGSLNVLIIHALRVTRNERRRFLNHICKLQKYNIPTYLPTYVYIILYYYNMIIITSRKMCF